MVDIGWIFSDLPSVDIPLIRSALFVLLFALIIIIMRRIGAQLVLNWWLVNEVQVKVALTRTLNTALLASIGSQLSLDWPLTDSTATLKGFACEPHIGGRALSHSEVALD